MLLAAANGDLKRVQELIQQGENVNCRGGLGEFRTPLHAACFYGHLEVAQALINTQGIDINSKGQFNYTPLHLACSEGHLQVAQALINTQGIDINSKDEDGYTPLHLACRKRRLQVVQALINAQGIELNAEDQLGQTPLFLSSMHSYNDVMHPSYQVSSLMKSNGAKIHVNETIVRKAIDCGYGLKRCMIFDDVKNHGEMKEEKGKIAVAISKTISKPRDTKRAKLMFDALFMDKMSDSELEDFLASKVHGMTIFGHLCKNHRVEIIQDILKRTKKPLNNGNPTPFWLAVSSGNLKIVQVLFQYQNVDFKKAGPDGTSPLDVAMLKGFSGNESAKENSFTQIFHEIKNKYGSKVKVHEQMISFGLSEFCKDKEVLKILNRDKKSTLFSAIQSDSHETVQRVLGMVENSDELKEELKEKAEERFNIEIRREFGLPFESLDSDLIQLSKTFHVFNDKCEESGDKRGIVKNDKILISALKELALDKFCCFPDEMENHLSKLVLNRGECSANCKQKTECSSVLHMITEMKQLEEQLGTRERTKDLRPKLILIGSIAEGTRLKQANEIDVTIQFQGLERVPFRVEDDATQVLVHKKAKEGILKEFIIEGTNNIFDYPKFLRSLLTEIQKTLEEMGYDIVNFFNESCQHEECKAESDSIYQPKKHCFEPRQDLIGEKQAMVTHTKIGPCIILKHKDKTLTIDLVPVFPIQGKGTMELFNTVTKTLIEKKYPGWVGHIKQIMKRDVILPEVYDDIKDKNVVYVALKILHYGPENNYIIRPGQEMGLEKFTEDQDLKEIYIYLKALKDILDINAKSFFMKKVILLPEFVEKCKNSKKHTKKYGLGSLLCECLSHPDLKPAFQEKIEIDSEETWFLRIKKISRIDQH